jgi:Domain of unknown function (DUF4382)
MDLATRKMVYYGLLGLIIAGSTIAVFRVTPQVVPVQFLAKDGTFAVYFSSVPSNMPSDIQSSQSVSSLGVPVVSQSNDNHGTGNILFSVVSLEVTIDSVMIHQNGANDSGWMTVSKGSVTIDLLKATSVSVLLASDRVPAENVTMVQLHVSNATATVKDPLGVLSIKDVLVSSEILKIPLGSGAIVKGQMSTSVVAYRPHIDVEGNGTIRLNPVLGVAAISGPQ